MSFRSVFARRPWTISLAIYAILSVTIATGLIISIEHVFRNYRYAPAGSLRYLLIWACLVNVSSAALLLCFGGRWRAHLSLLAAIDLIIAAGPFILIRLLRIPPVAAMAQYVASGYVTFMLLKSFILVLYAYLNSRTASYNSVRRWVMLTSLIVYVGFAAWISQSTWPVGDGVHYLLLTHSLVIDHDIDLANNYQNGDYHLFYPPHAHEHAIRNARGQALPIHDVGLSVSLIPGYVLAGKTGALLELSIPAALCALGILELSLLLGADLGSALIVWGLFAFSTPILMFASEISPEIVGAVLLLWAVIAFLIFLLRDGRPRFVLQSGVLLALLPWFSIRYWIFAGPLLAVMAACVVAQSNGNAHGWRTSIAPGLIRLAMPTAISLAIFMVYDKLHYGILLPNAGYVLDVRALRNTQLGFRPQVGFLGLLLDRAFGLFPVAPIYMLALVGALELRKTNRLAAAVILGPTGCYVAFVSFSQYWYGGWSPAARFLVTVAVLCAPFVSLAFSSGCVPRWLGSILAMWTLLITSIHMAVPNSRFVAVPDVTRGSVGVFLKQHFGVDPLTALFPSLIRAGRTDYLIAGAWLLLIITATRWLAARGSKLHYDEIVFCKRRANT
jgi:hypothetical protein